MKVEKFVEVEVADDLRAILMRETKNLLAKTEKWTLQDFGAFEKLAKVHVLLKDDLRDDIKSGLYDKLRSTAA